MAAVAAARPRRLGDPARQPGRAVRPRRADRLGRVRPRLRPPADRPADLSVRARAPLGGGGPVPAGLVPAGRRRGQPGRRGRRWAPFDRVRDHRAWDPGGRAAPSGRMAAARGAAVGGRDRGWRSIAGGIARERGACRPPPRPDARVGGGRRGPGGPDRAAQGREPPRPPRRAAGGSRRPGARLQRRCTPRAGMGLRGRRGDDGAGAGRAARRRRPPPAALRPPAGHPGRGGSSRRRALGLAGEPRPAGGRPRRPPPIGRGGVPGGIGRADAARALRRAPGRGPARRRRSAGGALPGRLAGRGGAALPGCARRPHVQHAGGRGGGGPGRVVAGRPPAAYPGDRRRNRRHDGTGARRAAGRRHGLHVHRRVARLRGARRHQVRGLPVHHLPHARHRPRSGRPGLRGGILRLRHRRQRAARDTPSPPVVGPRPVAPGARRPAHPPGGDAADPFRRPDRRADRRLVVVCRPRRAAGLRAAVAGALAGAAGGGGVRGRGRGPG